MKLTGKIAGDIKDFVKPVEIKSAAGILRIWVIVLGEDSAQFFLIKDRSLDFIGLAVSLKAASRERKEGSDFLPKMAQWLHDALEENAFDRLLFVASESLWSETQRFISHPVACRVLAEVKRDFSRMGFGALQRELTKIVWP